MPGAIANGSICWACQLRSYPRRLRPRACLSECRLWGYPGRKSWCSESPRRLNKVAAAGANRRSIRRIALSAGGRVGLVLIYTGTPRAEWNWLYTHILLSGVGVGILFAIWAGSRGWGAGGTVSAILRTAICLILLAGLGAGARYLRVSRWQTSAVIANPSDPPPSMDGEGDG